MSPLPPPDDLGPVNALLAAVRPIWLVGLGGAALAFAVARFDARLAAVEHDIAVLTAIACADRPQDSLCRSR